MAADKVRKELILIYPKAGNIFVRNLVALIERYFMPISMLTLAALTPKDYKIRIFNYKTFFLKKDLPEGALVGITCYSMNTNIAYALARKYKKAGAVVIMGGSHVTCLPDEALQYCDSVVVGEAESVWGEVIRDFEAGELKQKYSGRPLDDFFTPVYKYFLNLPALKLLLTGIQTTRGCKYNCEFCALPFRKFRTINQDQVIELVKKVSLLTKIFPLYFKDDNIYSDPVYAKELFKKLIPLKIKWFSFSSIDIAFDDEALKLAKASGCHNLTIGIETLYPEKLPKLSSKLKSRDDLVRALKKIRSYGIKVRGAFIMGFDYHTHKDYWDLLLFFIKVRFYFIVLGILTPFAGSALYEKLADENRIANHDWRKFDCLHVVFQPKNTSRFSLQMWFIFLRTITFFIQTQTLLLFILLIIVYIMGSLPVPGPEY